MLKVTTERLEDNQARLLVEIDEARVDQELKRAARKIAKQVNIPGFRKGKAPYHVIVRTFGEAAVYDEALEPLGQAVYAEALEQSELNPYAPGSLDDVKLETPMTMSFTVPLAPEIDLGDYREVRLPYEAAQVTDEDLEHALEHLQENEAVLEPVERAAQLEDVLTMDVLGVLKDEDEDDLDEERGNRILIDRKGLQVKLRESSQFPVPGFSQEVVGMLADDEREFDIVLPEDDTVDEDFRGKTVHFTTKCIEVFNHDLPELDNEFAQSIGDYESLADLKAKVQEDLERTAAREASDNYADKVLSKLMDDEIATVAYPPIMLEEQIDDMVRDFESRLSSQGMSLDIYLKGNNMDEDELRDSYEESADRMIRRGLMLGKLTELEQLNVSDDEITDEIETRILGFGTEAALARQLFSSPRMRQSLATELLTGKALERLALIGRGEAPDLASLEEPEEVPADSESEVIAAESVNDQGTPTDENS